MFLDIVITRKNLSVCYTDLKTNQVLFEGGDKQNGGWGDGLFWAWGMGDEKNVDGGLGDLTALGEGG